MARIKISIMLMILFLISTVLVGGWEGIASAESQRLFRGAGCPPAASCSTLQNSFTNTPTGQNQVGNSSSTLYIGQQFTAAASYIACSIEVNLEKIGTGQDVTVYIYSDDGADSPNTSLGTCGSISAAAMNDAAFEWEITSCNISLTNGTKYWLVLKAAAWNSSNYVYWGRASVNSNIDNDADGAGTWSDYSTVRTSNYRIYGP